MSTPVQQRIAARIHFILKRDLGEGINVAAMLSDANEAREVLFVCQASGNPELVSLARRYVNAGKLAKPESVKRDAPQDAAWASNTSGFGVTQACALSAPEESSWRNATQWLRRSPHRAAR